MYLQQRIDGTPGSVSFAADGSNAVILGFSRQLVADPRLGARRFRYCGSILGHSGIRLFPRQKELLERVAEIVATVTQAFRLVGLNGIDFIARRGIPFPIEVNPRYSASMELIERAHNLSMFQIHAQACDGLLPQITEQGKPQVHGKAIVFAREESVIAANSSWSSCGWMADIPHPGERIQQGRPVCTVFASARSPEACRRLLWRKADAVYRKLKWPRKRAA
jgi:predicted ATP-grasp superfamily ATP-dependent carboligase